ncbi:MAG: hypothetical protein WAM89_07095 [Terriglobales bacterium]
MLRRLKDFNAAATLVVTVLFGMFFAANTAEAQTIAYNSIPSAATAPDNVASEGPEAYAFVQLGDGLNLVLPPPHDRLTSVTVVMSSWACQNGNWYTPGTCVTTPGATYTMPITLNVYSVVSGTSLEGNPAPSPGTLLRSVTQPFTLPYRPSSDSINCDGTAWYDAGKRICNHGVAVPITFNLSSSQLVLPSQIIVTVAYNTTHYGPNPVGEGAACFGTPAGCFYDSLNISTDDNGGNYKAAGSPLDVTGIFVENTYASSACNSNGTTGVLGDDAAPGCWTNYHPQIKVLVH